MREDGWETETALVLTLKRIMKIRPDLRVIISSATLEAKLFETFFKIYHHNETEISNNNTHPEEESNNVGILSVEGKQFPVHIQYLAQPSPNYIQSTLDTIKYIHNNGNNTNYNNNSNSKSKLDGDILVFLPGRESVDSVVEAVNEENIASLYAVPMYGGLTLDEQLKAVERPPYGVRKVVVGKNKKKKGGGGGEMGREVIVSNLNHC